MSSDDKRPLSPHLQIYDLPLTARLSLLHRGTGILLFVALWVLTGVLVAAAGGEESWQQVHGYLSSWPGRLVLLGFTFSLYFHLCSGIRHLFWDIGKGFSSQNVAISNALIILVSSLLTLLTWLLAWSQG